MEIRRGVLLQPGLQGRERPLVERVVDDHLQNDHQGQRVLSEQTQTALACGAELAFDAGDAEAVYHLLCEAEGHCLGGA